jgi:hypothetical protein
MVDLGIQELSPAITKRLVEQLPLFLGELVRAGVAQKVDRKLDDGFCFSPTPHLVLAFCARGAQKFFQHHRHAIGDCSSPDYRFLAAR